MTMHTLKWAAAQATGNAHIAEALPLQDAKALRLIEGADGHTWIAAAVADGAGSAPLADIGARAASAAFVSAVSSALRVLPKPDLVRIAFNAMATARIVLDRIAKTRKVPVSDLATTLLGCITRGEETVVVQIGDGVIVVGPPWRVALRPQRGEYVNTANFLSQDDWREQIEIGVITEAVGTVVLVTDGIEELVVSPARLEPHSAFFEYLSEGLRASLADTRERREASGVSAWLQGFLESPAVRSRTDDDTSIIAIQLQGEDHVDCHP